MDWIFDGGRPSVDLVNTMRDRHLGGRELLVDPAALIEWLTLMKLVEHRSRATRDQLAAAHELREAIDRLARGGRSAHDVRLLNTTAQAAPVPQLRLAHGRPTRQTANTVATAMATLAIDAIELVASGAEVRICAWDHCGLRFVDTSPEHNRQWCSMSRCGNRAKARAHYARRKAQ
ncbi:CGNR zinc finger domain-containing protein [Amycolatopsis acididurans]|uniref:CGNR zinc finger domain-containing protein n=1 Tax=Amycolatopsis acididurans TaxID=2724524 RepID=UPI0028AC5BC5|nr:ABATE domain-containing protein [Amycolatopsis acididurans]